MSSGTGNQTSVSTGDLRDNSGAIAVGSNITQIIFQITANDSSAFEQLSDLFAQISARATRPASSSERGHKMSKTISIAKVWQRQDDGEYSQNLVLEHDEAAILFPINGAITKEVHTFLETELHLEPDILIITNADSPDLPKKLDPAKPGEWEEIVTSFKELLIQLKANATKRIHVFFNGPVVLAFALGTAAGYNQYNIYFYHYYAGTYARTNQTQPSHP